jgi:hypothetical protein
LEGGLEWGVPNAPNNKFRILEKRILDSEGKLLNTEWYWTKEHWKKGSIHKF